VKVLVCGSIGYGGLEYLTEIKNMLREEGIEVLDRLVDKDKDMDYSDIKDFRDKPEVADRIVNRHLGLVRESDVIVVVLNGPSYGAAMEMCVGKQLGKRIILFCENEVPTPWPIYFSNRIIRTRKGLIKILTGEE
jgi:nucleoside 2-deoxyribosyltransferase